MSFSPKRIVLHHAAFDFKNASLVSRLNDITSWHLSRGFSGCGYHVLVSDTSYLVGRPLDRQGAHVLGSNSDTLGVCLTADLSSRIATESEISQLVAAILMLRSKFGPLPVVAHNQLAPTYCPGPYLLSQVNASLSPPSFLSFYLSKIGSLFR